VASSPTTPVVILSVVMLPTLGDEADVCGDAAVAAVAASDSEGCGGDFGNGDGEVSDMSKVTMCFRLAILKITHGEVCVDT
jgi:hypothetical protein